MTIYIDNDKHVRIMGCGPSRSEIEAQEAREKKALKDQEELAEKVTILNATPFFMALAPAELEVYSLVFFGFLQSLTS